MPHLVISICVEYLYPEAFLVGLKFKQRGDKLSNKGKDADRWGLPVFTLELKK